MFLKQYFAGLDSLLSVQQAQVAFFTFVKKRCLLLMPLNNYALVQKLAFIEHMRQFFKIDLQRLQIVQTLVAILLFFQSQISINSTSGYGQIENGLGQTFPDGSLERIDDLDKKGLGLFDMLAQF
ncbi:hypothetical protein BpHYR1_002181 [Brachionus plicatilis]|uniref:Uncharacterized protein n=1 Tax=Brachionus plicatilis TaxID=10195 RepID=A0A3M7QAG9_BRAPC|nr:hypothetical protein BpHYR1_002181 [Brachionus plicatilis]